MARKKHLINVHTSTGTTAPTGASLYLGEIAVQHTPNDPALWIKVGSAETSTEYEKFIGLTEITNIFNMSHILGSGYTYSGLPYVNSATTIADAYSALTNELIDDELVTAAALNDLNQRVVEISGKVGDNTELIEYIQENEEVVAGALNNLNNRVSVVETHMTGDYIPITGYMLASGATEEELTLRETDTVNEALGKLQKQSLDNEEAIAAGLNDLNQRVTANAQAIARNTGVTQLSGAVRSLSAATYYGLGEMFGETHNLSSATKSLSSATINLSGAVMGISAKTSGILTINANGVEQGRYSPSANTTIDLQIVQDVTGADVLLTGYELATGTTEEELAIVATDTVNEAFGKIQKQNYDNEAVIAGALNDLDERVLALEAGGGTDEIRKEIEDQELVVAAALNDLNNRIIDLSGDSSYHSSQIQILSGLVADISGNTGGGGGGGEGAVTAVTVTGTGNAVTNATFSSKALTLTKGNVQATISDLAAIRSNAASGLAAYNNVNTLSAATTGINSTLNTVSGAAHNKITTLSGATVSISGYAHSKITALSAATTGINATLTAHTNNGDIHVTAANKTTWNGKQDAITDLAEIRSNAASGMAAYNNVNTLSAGTISELAKKSNTGHTHAISDITNLQTTLDGKSGTGHTHSNYATTGTVNTLSNTVTAHTANTSIHVTTAQTAAWDGKQDAISDLATIRSNAEAGAAKVSNVQSDWNATTGLAVILNKPTIPSAPGTLTTTATTAQSTATNEALTGNISLHKVSKTGSYNDLTNKPTIPTVPAWATASTKPTYTASEVGALPTGTTLDGIADGTTRKLSNYATTGTVNTLNNTVTAHTANTTIHVTTAQTAAWNGKQDAISDLATIRTNAASGMAAYNNVNALSAATTAMSVNVGKIAVTGVTVTGTGNAVTNASYSNSALTLTKGNVLTAETLTGVSLAGTAVTLSNKVAPIPSASSSAFGVVKTGNFISNNNGTIAVSTGTTNTTVAVGSHTHTASQVGALPTGTTLDGIADGTTRKLSNYATTGTVNTHTGTTIPNRTSGQMHLPTVSASDNGKILRVVNGAWALVDPATIYYGSGTPAQSLGNDGDIYIQTS